MVYRTKIGSGFRIFGGWQIGLSVVGLAFTVGGLATQEWASLTVGLAILTVGLSLIALLLLIVWPMDYDPGASGPDGEPILLVRCGRLVRYRIPLAEIREVRPSAEVGSSPASWSYDRLKVVYRTGSIHRCLLISPRDRDGFLDELARRVTHLERDGDSLMKTIAIHGSSIEPASV
jgi:Bacterial PH domain